ncbi:MAG: hypothetical protein ABI838_02490 [Chloroflexota bacterium]
MRNSLAKLTKPTVAAAAAWFAAGSLGLSGPDTVDFGSKTGSARPYPTQTVSVQNVSGQSLHIDEVNTGGPGTEDFAIEADGCSRQTLTPGAGCSVVVAFAPGFQNGTTRYRGQLVFWSGGRSQFITLTGTEESGPPSGNPGVAYEIAILLALLLSWWLIALVVFTGVVAVMVVAWGMLRRRR